MNPQPQRDNEEPSDIPSDTPAPSTSNDNLLDLLGIGPQRDLDVTVSALLDEVRGR